jgi:Tol biopolymer transport system component
MPARRDIGAFLMAGVLAAACCTPASAFAPNTTILLSRPSGLGTLPISGDNRAEVGLKAMSGDGRFIVFTSGADDLGVSDTRIHVWLRDTASGATTLVDHVAGGGEPGNGNASQAAISRDGSRVCFRGTATNLVAGVAGTHVFVATPSTGAIVIADRATGAGGAVGNGDAVSFCGLDATGTRVVFESEADNLVPNDGNDEEDVFVRDLGAGTTERVSVNSMGAEASNGGFGASISADGLKVAFVAADPLVSGDTNNSFDLYVRNRQAGTLVRASVDTGGVQANGHSFEGAIDDAGTHVAFVSQATNLELGNDTNGVTDVFWRDLVSDTTVLVSRATGGAGALGDGESISPAISGDGLGVAFQSTATNLGAGAPPPEGRWIYLRRLGTNVTSLLSRASGADGVPADASASTVSLGTAPTVAAWESEASNLDPDAPGEFNQVFQRVLTGGLPTTLVSRPDGSAPRSALLNNSFLPNSPAVSADGRLVLFVSLADGLEPAAADPFVHLFVRDVVSNTTTLVDRGPGPSGAAADAGSGSASIAAGGSHVAFFSRATNLVPGVTSPQVYVRDLVTGALEVASRADGVAGAVALVAVDSGMLGISGDGRRVAFAADDSLVSADTNLHRDVYLRDLVAGTTTLVSVATDGGAGDDRSFRPSVSEDGTRVAFTSRSTNLLDGETISDDHVYVRDLVAGTTVLADRGQDGLPGTGRADNAEISGAGNHVVFSASEALTADPIPPGSALYVRDLAGGVTLLVSREAGADGAAAAVFDVVSISRDGTRVGWVGSGPGLPGGAERPLAYLRDLAAATTRLVSAVNGTAATPPAPEPAGTELSNPELPHVALDAAGSCVAFASRANDLTTPAYATRDFNHIYLRAVDDGCLPAVTTSTTLPPGSGTAIAAKTVVLRPGRLVKFVAKGLSIPPGALPDPTRGGGTLVVEGTTGSVSFPLAASGWKAVGRRGPKGFKFKSASCRVTLLRRRIKAACRGETGGLTLPEPGPLQVLLVAESAAYCAECGGRPAGRASRVFKRRACPAPATCP